MLQNLYLRDQFVVDCYYVDYKVDFVTLTNSFYCCAIFEKVKILIILPWILAGGAVNPLKVSNSLFSLDLAGPVQKV